MILAVAVALPCHSAVAQQKDEHRLKWDETRPRVATGESAEVASVQLPPQVAAAAEEPRARSRAIRRGSRSSDSLTATSRLTMVCGTRPVARPTIA